MSECHRKLSGLLIFSGTSGRGKTPPPDPGRACGWWAVMRAAFELGNNDREFEWLSTVDYDPPFSGLPSPLSERYMILECNIRSYISVASSIILVPEYV